MGKRGQVTLFIIIAIIVVGALLVYLLWIKPTYVQPSGGRPGFEGCVDDVIAQAVEELGVTAGFVDPEFTYMYNSLDFSYLCYTNLYHTSCINQKPFLKQHFEENLLKVSREKINLCYQNSLNDLRARGYTVSASKPDVRIDLRPGKVLVMIDAATSTSLDGEASQTTRGVDVSVPSSIYEMVIISTSIIQYEVAYGDCDISTLMLFYPQFVIDKIKRSDGTKVYILQDKDSENKFQFATRSFALPAGMDISK